MSKGLLVFILKENGCGCTNGGVTEKANRAILYWDGVPEIFSSSDDTPALQLQKRCGRLIAVPVNDPRMKTHCGPMFGGNFIYTSDSRFPNEYPIPVHDRFETQELNDLMSR